MAEISIIVPVYKADKYIESCVRSILAQTFEDFELLLVNDGSPDDSGSICDMLSREDERIHVIHKKNGGVSSARNRGLNMASGKYIMFCDSDDYVEADWCQNLYDLIRRPEVSLAFCGYQSVEVSNHNVKGQQKYSSEETAIVPRTEFWNIYMHNLMNMPWNKIYLADVIRKNGIAFDESLQYNEDLLFILDYIRHSKGDFGIANICTYNYVQGIEGSLTRRHISNLWEIKKRVFKTMNLVLQMCEIDLNDIKTEYYNKWIWAIVFSINNNSIEETKKGLRNVWRENQKILSSEECRIAFKNGNFKAYHPAFSIVLRSRSYLLFVIFEQLVKMWNCLKKKK